MDTRKSSVAIDGARSNVAAEIKSGSPQSGKSSGAPEVCNAGAGLKENNLIVAGEERTYDIAPAGRKLNVTGVRAAPAKNLSRQIMLATGRPTTAKRRPVTAKELSLGFASSFPVVMAWPSDAPGGPPAFPREAIPALRLHFQSSRAEYVERRLNAHNEGVIELYCKLCLRLIVASRDEFVFPIAVKAHKCGEAWTQGARRVDGENALKTSRPA
jgi:hypothetical protein